MIAARMCFMAAAMGVIAVGATAYASGRPSPIDLPRVLMQMDFVAFGTVAKIASTKAGLVFDVLPTSVVLGTLQASPVPLNVAMVPPDIHLGTRVMFWGMWSSGPVLEHVGEGRRERANGSMAVVNPDSSLTLPQGASRPVLIEGGSATSPRAASRLAGAIMKMKRKHVSGWLEGSAAAALVRVVAVDSKPGTVEIRCESWLTQHAAPCPHVLTWEWRRCAEYQPKVGDRILLRMPVRASKAVRVPFCISRLVVRAGFIRAASVYEENLNALFERVNDRAVLKPLRTSPASGR